MNTTKTSKEKISVGISTRKKEVSNLMDPIFERDTQCNTWDNTQKTQTHQISRNIPDQRQEQSILYRTREHLKLTFTTIQIHIPGIIARQETSYPLLYMNTPQEQETITIALTKRTVISRENPLLYPTTSAERSKT